MSLWWKVIKPLCGQYGSNHIVGIVSWLEFVWNIAKFNKDQIICNVDKDWSKFTKWTIWISLYWPWLKFFKNILSSKKELSMETYVESLKSEYSSNRILSWFEFPICTFDKIDQCFLNGKYRSNHFICHSNSLKTFETEKKSWNFNENLIESLKRKITVKTLILIPKIIWALG